MIPFSGVNEGLTVRTSFSWPNTVQLILNISEEEQVDCRREQRVGLKDPQSKFTTKVDKHMELRRQQVLKTTTKRD